VVHRVEHLARLLRARSRIEERERLAVELLLEDREIRSQGSRVKLRSGLYTHVTANCNAPHIRPSSAQGTLNAEMATNSRIERARTRARSAKAVIASGTLLVFGAAFVGTKAYAAGHTKGKAKALDAPKSFKQAVKRSIAEGGVIAPAVQPPPIGTSTS
jgi:hypothetical protein